MSQRATILLTAALLCPCACDRAPGAGPPERIVELRAPGARDGSPEPTIAAARVEQSTLTHTRAPDTRGAGGASSIAAGDEALVGEERERDLRSDTVKIKVLGAEKRMAHVFWGRKDLGVAPLEIARPRNSGPLDLVVIAPGYLPFHARAFTDRDDLVSVRLYTATEAPQLLGYRASEVPAARSTTGAAAGAREPAANPR